MWIRSKDKKMLIDVMGVEISSVFGDKKNKAIVWGFLKSNSLFSSNKIELGMYPTKEGALAELDSIEKCISNNINGVYTMKS